MQFWDADCHAQGIWMSDVADALFSLSKVLFQFGTSCNLLADKNQVLGYTRLPESDLTKLL